MANCERISLPHVIIFVDILNPLFSSEAIRLHHPKHLGHPSAQDAVCQEDSTKDQKDKDRS